MPVNVASQGLVSGLPERVKNREIDSHNINIKRNSATLMSGRICRKRCEMLTLLPVFLPGFAQEG